MRVNSGQDNGVGSSIVIYATGDEYEAKLVEGGISHGGRKQTKKTSKLKGVLGNRRTKNRTLSALVSVRLTSNKPTPEHDHATSNNPFDDDAPFDERKHDRAMGAPIPEKNTNPFAFEDGASSAHSLAGKNTNPFDDYSN